MNMHPADEIRGSKSKILFQKTIVFAVTGSIAAVETIKLARELIRHGARVIPVMTKAATSIIHPDALWFATGERPIVSLSGETEHVKWCGIGRDSADLVLISPCTANTLSKIAMGIDDTAVTTFATTAIGSKIPVMIVPAMHLSMYDHRMVQENVEKLRRNGIVIVDPVVDATKAKIASKQQIIMKVLQTIGLHELKAKKVLVIGGGTAEPVDAVRSLCNLSSGRMAVACVRQAFLKDADIRFWYGTGSEPVPDYISEVKRFRTNNELKTLINDYDLTTVDIIIVCAALADFLPEKANEKISSDKDELIISCKPADKIISLIRQKAAHAILIGFKLEKDKETLIEKAVSLLNTHSLDYVIANPSSNLNKSEGEAILINKDQKQIQLKGSKTMIADGIYEEIIKNNLRS